MKKLEEEIKFTAVFNFVEQIAEIIDSLPNVHKFTCKDKGSDENRKHSKFVIYTTDTGQIPLIVHDLYVQGIFLAKNKPIKYTSIVRSEYDINKPILRIDVEAAKESLECLDAKKASMFIVCLYIGKRHELDLNLLLDHLDPLLAVSYTSNDPIVEIPESELPDNRFTIDWYELHTKNKTQLVNILKELECAGVSVLWNHIYQVDLNYNMQINASHVPFSS